MKIVHTDVFSEIPFSGNGLTVVFPEQELASEEMQKIACEFKQFETIFLYPDMTGCFRARIFTTQEELDFAGHPLLGAAAVVHHCFNKRQPDNRTTFRLKQKEVTTVSLQKGNHYEVTMNQGKPEFLRQISAYWRMDYCKALNLTEDDLAADFPMEVVSTGLPYLLIPLRSGLEKAQIVSESFEALLIQNHAKFVYLFDMNKMEGRTWDNTGELEDVATGSAAGPMAAYLYNHGAVPKGESILIHQGSHLGRPSIMKASLVEETGDIMVSGAVVMIAEGTLDY